MLSKRCQFERVREGVCRCQECGSLFMTPAPPESIDQRCYGQLRKFRPVNYVDSDYVRPDERPPITRRNLIYHLWPAHEEIWRWNVDHILRRWELFNGKKVIGIAVDEKTCDAETVKAAFPDDPDIDWYVFDNDPQKRETTTLRYALKALQSMNEDEATFFCHGKGVFRATASHGKQPVEVTAEIVRQWTEIMYRFNLDYWHDVHEALLKHPCVGILKRYGSRFGFDPQRYWPWHYSGSFYWFHHPSLFSFPNVHDVENHRFAVEPYLAQFFRPDEGACLFMEGCGLPYEKKTWEREIYPALLKRQMEEYALT